ncbi:hypothetical protein SAMN04488095_0373 [Jannaschia pohangensis]|uniref:Zinc-ribbon domain-containing protein n=2 Tax=Jannaschia pohangensis TaxID=390807 RepID=A0A1I3GXN6_9RHOB|nr:hypothetical protein SAMN04488095_0373 [Jannaschia pohangensis]
MCPQCGNQVHFNNSQCFTCHAVLAYAPLEDQLVGLTPDMTAPSGRTCCSNREKIGCNWLRESNDSTGLCLSCLHTTRIPDTFDPIKAGHWSRLERAKRRLFYALIKFGLPLEPQPDRTTGSLMFEFLSDEIKPDGKVKRVMTGHASGCITINIEEADDAIREKHRTALREPYRTLIGHFRHEVAHYYWEKLIVGQDMLDACRATFGDDRADYGAALRAHYANGPRPDWQQSFVSSYACAHPWEDFAETWAHYFHMVGGLETAYAYGLNPQPIIPGAPQLVQLDDPYHVSDHAQLLEHWVPLTVAMNAMNRAMGHRDYYPFALTPVISDKLKFIHDLIEAQ